MPNRFEARPVGAIFAILALLGLAAELGLRLANPRAVAFAYEARQVHRYSRRWRVDLVPDGTAHLRIADRKRGGDLLNFVLSTNSDGFRAPDRLRDRPAPGPGTRFVHAIGDSYSMGWGVCYEASYPARLEELLGPPFRVLNLGVDGYGTLGATQKSMDLASRYPPAATVYLFSPNDFADDRQALAVSRRSALHHRGAELLDALRRRSYLANVPFALRWWLFFNGSPGGDETAGQDARLLVSADPTIDRDPATLPPPDADNPSLVQLAAYARFLQARGAPLLVLALSTQPESLVCYRFCRDHGIESRLVEVALPLRLSGEGHFSPLGNEQIARFVHTTLVRRLGLRPDATP
jgi:hypothetical protein